MLKLNLLALLGVSGQESQWFSQGLWPLVGAILVLLITNGVSLWQVLLGAKKSLALQLRLGKIQAVDTMLREFYNPVFTLLSINKYVFQNFGPHTFPSEEIARQVAGETWTELKTRVILPNNRELADTLRRMSHHICMADDIKHYLELANHLACYEIFVDMPTEQYAKFRFPNSIEEHVSTVRGALVEELNRISAEE